VPSIRKLAWGGLALTGIAAVVYAGVTSRGPSASTTTLTPGWERRFRLEWTVEPDTDRTRRLRGYVTSLHGAYAETVRLLVQSVDAGGVVVERRLWAIPGGVNGFQRAYFEVAELPVAQEYRVFVWDYTIHQS
jgi:hypothetical protein